MGDLYRFYDADDRLLYVGISLMAAQRANDHRKGARWWDDVARMDVEKVPDDQLRSAERSAIRRERPLHNVTHAVKAETTMKRDKRARRLSDVEREVQDVREMLGDAPIAVSPSGAAEMLGVTRPTIYKMIERGELRRFKVGRCARIPIADVRALVGG